LERNLSFRLSELSRREFGCLPQIQDWPDALDADGWCMSRELSPLHAAGRLQDTPLELQKRLALFEIVNFFSLNIHGERALLGGLGASLYGPHADPSFVYLHHFVDEENKHMQYFASFCLRYAGKIYADRHVTFPREHAPGEEAFLFFSKVLIFEEIVDYFNRWMARDTSLLPIIRQINQMHHDDEVRHLAFGRMVTKKLFDQWSPSWSPETLAAVRSYLGGYIDATLREYINPEVYLDAGLVGTEPGAMSRAYALAREAFDGSADLRARASRRPRAFFAALGVLGPATEQRA
jgi:hypothetical protein